MSAGRDDARAARLAGALRANLKRRKAAGREVGEESASPPVPESPGEPPPDPSGRD